MRQLLDDILELKKYIANSDHTNTGVSMVTIGWHIEHSLLVIREITKALEQSDINQYQRQMNFSKMMVLYFNFKIPRGRAKAPKQVVPRSIITWQSLEESVERTIECLEIINRLHPQSNFIHPVFKQLNKKETIKFLSIHTRHHKSIMDSMLKG